MQASSTDGCKGQKALNACLVWDFSGTRSEPVTAAVAGFSSAPWPEFGPPYTAGEQAKILLSANRLSDPLLRPAPRRLASLFAPSSCENSGDCSAAMVSGKSVHLPRHARTSKTRQPHPVSIPSS